MNLKEHVPLAPLTTFGVGGPARFFVEAESAEEVVEALAFARERALPVFALGGGSNIVIADSGFDGLVIALRIQGVTTENKDNGKTFVTVGAGVAWDDFVVWSIEKKLSGLECMSGVPGTVGGAVVANVGAYGAQVSDTFVSAEIIDTKGASDKVQAIQVIKKEECGFSYHDSLFGRSGGRYIVVSATFSLSADPAVTPSYKDNRFDMAELSLQLGHKPTQQEVRDSVLKMREEKGSLIMKGRKSFRCAGSFFHMPFVSNEKYDEAAGIARTLDAEREKALRPWAWEQPDGSYKLAPGFLLEYTEFQKGFVRGGAGVSPLHALSIINVGNARASEIAELALDMQNAVEKIFGIKLEPEVEYVGDVENRIL
ncbi:UDP-N-acetylmuramate dehydrogenase [Candidatus Kaiserbacteria bacterium]|nr:UDP-N-acetylmuramate dehydrogenase [Candidatus Kaiserbacteria bacterium]